MKAEEGARRDIDVDAVFDIETEEWDRFVAGGILTADGAYFEYRHEREERMVDQLLEFEGTVWAHSGGTFDFKWLLDHVAIRGLKARIIAAGSRIVSARVGKLRLCDSRALVPMTLAKFTAGLSVSKEELAFPCKCEEDCGGYCSISRRMPERMWKRLLTYLRADCGSLFAGLQKLRAFAAEHDLDLGATIGSSAWKNAARILGLPPAELTPAEHNFARGGYYGGRVQLYRWQKVRRCHERDVSSLYPWTLREFALPVGRPVTLEGRLARKAHRDGAAGFYQARVAIPEMHLPPLPFRYQNATRTAYPTGTIEGVWPMPELEHAESRGAVVLSISKALAWERTEVFFTPWIDRLFKLRAAVGKKEPMGQFLKLYLNSVTGKCGSNPERIAYTINPSQVYVCRGAGDCRAREGRDCGRCCDIHCSQKCGASIQFSKYIWGRPAWHLDSCAHVEWAGYLTSHGRVTLNRQQIALDGEGRDLVYSDTDGILSEYDRPENSGSDIGQWERGGIALDFDGIAPKVYRYRHDPKDCHRGGDDKPCKECAAGKVGKTQRAKGIRLPKGAPIVVGRKYPAAGIIGFKHGATLGKLFVRNRASRELQRQLGDRVRVGRNGYTRAPAAGELDL